MFHPTQHSHRRYNPLIGQWVLCSPHRALRPWQGGIEPIFDKKPTYDPKCYLCPGNSRVKGDNSNPQYESTFTFTNDFPAMQMDLPLEETSTNNSIDILKLQRVRGTSKVICYTPHHHLTMATLPLEGVFSIVKEWKNIYSTFSKMKSTEKMKYVQIFENKGQAMGCSNPHPHGQVWASDQIPTIPQLEYKNLSVFKKEHGSCLLCEYSRLEASSKLKASRVVDETEDFISVVPFWATWPFEMLILSKPHLSDISKMEPKTLLDLAKILKYTTTRYDNLFECDFPYSMGIHQAPLSTGLEVGEHLDLSHFHIHFYPPLLRSATVKKWMVGFEMLGESQRDITPEQAAERLRSLSSSIHYTESITNVKKLSSKL